MTQTAAQPARRDSAAASNARPDGFNQGAATVRDYAARQVRPYLAFLTVAGGFGGPGAGAVAARICTQVAEHELDPGLFEGPEGFKAGAEAALSRAFNVAGSKIFEAGADPANSGMGATMTCAACDEDCAFVGHVGNARGYLLTSRGLRQVTSDHVEYLDGRRTRLTRALGVDESVECDVLKVPLKPAEVLLICSHAVYSSLDDEVIGASLRAPDLQAACDYLCSEARNRGATGDIGAAAWRVPFKGPGQVPSDPDRPEKRPRGRRGLKWTAALLAVVLLAAAAIGAWFLWGRASGEAPARRTRASAPAAVYSEGDVVEIDTTGEEETCYLFEHPGGPEEARLYDGWKARVRSSRADGVTRWYRVEMIDGVAQGREGWVKSVFLGESK